MMCVECQDGVRSRLMAIMGARIGPGFRGDVSQLSVTCVRVLRNIALRTMDVLRASELAHSALFSLTPSPFLLSVGSFGSPLAARHPPGTPPLKAAEGLTVSAQGRACLPLASRLTLALSPYSRHATWIVSHRCCPFTHSLDLQLWHSFYAISIKPWRTPGP